MRNFIIQESATISPITNVEETSLGTLKFVAVMQEANKPNRNKRIYDKENLDRAIHSEYITERLAGGTLYGEAGHPLDLSLQRQTNIDHHNIAMIIRKLWWEGNLLMGLCETANTATGKDMAGLIKQNCKIGISLRAQGGVEKDPISGYSKVKPGLQIFTWDWVVCPSNDQAYIQNVLSDETKMNVFGSHIPTHTQLQEVQMLYESGNLFEVEPDGEALVESARSYIAGYNKKLRSRDEIYVKSDNDKLIVESINGKYAEVQNNNVKKQVVLEDFLTQDLRKHIIDFSK